MKNVRSFIILLLVMALTFTVLVGCARKDPKLQEIIDKGEIIWGTNAAFAPFEMRSGSDVIGVDAEIAKKIAEKLGVKLVVDDMEFSALPGALTSNIIDFIAAGYTIKPDREEQVLFTDTYFTAVQVIIVQDTNTDIKGPNDLVNKRIGVQESTTGDFIAQDLVEEGDGSGKVTTYINGMEAALDLKNGRVDAVIIDNLPAQMIVNQNTGLKILEEKAGEDEEYALAVRKGDTALQKLINEILKELKESGQIDDWVAEYSYLD